MSIQRFRCERCQGRLGTYSVELDMDGLLEPEVVPIRLPKGMVAWDGIGARPRLFFRMEPASWTRGGIMVDGGLSARGADGTKYRWRCSCGHSPVYLPRTLAAKIRAPQRFGGSTVYL